MRTEFHFVTGQGARLVRIAGVIDETFDRQALAAGLGRGSDPIVFDLEGVRRITSFGVREWITALRELPTDRYYFVRCHPSIIAQFNMVANFGAMGQVVSFYCPFACPECGHELEQLIDIRRHKDRVFVPSSVPAVACPKCQSPAEFDDIPDAYFAYLALQPPLTVPAQIEALIDGGGASSGRVPLRVDKEVEGRVTAIWLWGALDKDARFKRLADGLEGKVILVAQGVTQVTPEGMLRFYDLANMPEVDIYIARVPLAMARAMAQQAGALGKAQVVSLRLPFVCQAGCSVEAELEVPIRPAEPFGLLPGEAPCPRCRRDLVCSVRDEDLLPLTTRLPMRPPPSEVAAYLANRTAVGNRGGDPPGLRPFPLTGEQRISGARGPSSGEQAAAAAEPWRESDPAAVAGGIYSRPTGGLSAGSGSGARYGALGRYELLHLIGTGGMAEVFLGRQLGLEGFEKRVVIKRILPHFARDAAFVQMFLQEARLAARISHSNVVQIFDLGKSENDYYIVMEHVRGWNLNTLLKIAADVDVAMPVELACRVVSDMCAGLHAAHSAVDAEGRPLRVVHRDVSPHNVLVSIDGLVKLTDFGIAKAVDSASITKTGNLKGKILYMAPETIREEKIDGRADVFAAGLVLYVALVFEHPFERGNDFQRLSAVLTGEIPPVTKLRPEVPAKLQEIVERALARKKEERYQTAQALQLDLEAFLAEYGRPATSAHLGLFIRELLAGAEQQGIRPPPIDRVPTSSLSPSPSPAAPPSPTAPLVGGELPGPRPPLADGPWPPLADGPRPPLADAPAGPTRGRPPPLAERGIAEAATMLDLSAERLFHIDPERTTRDEPSDPADQGEPGEK